MRRAHLPRQQRSVDLVGARLTFGADFLERREPFLEAPSEQPASLANKVRREVE